MKNNKLETADSIQDYNNLITYDYSILNSLPFGIFWKDAQSIYKGANTIALDNTDLSLGDVINSSVDDMPWATCKTNINKLDSIIISSKLLYEVEDMAEFNFNASNFNYCIKLPWIQNETVIGTIGIGMHVKKNNTTQQSDNNINNAIQYAISKCSHDIKLPINSVVGNLQLARFVLKKNNTRQAILLLDKANRSMLALLNVFEQFKNIYKSTNQSFFLFSLVQYEVELAQSLTHPMQNLQVLYSVDSPANTHIYGNLHKIAQVLRNLLSNAVKFTSEGLITLKVSVMSNEKLGKGHLLIFYIKDTGCGMNTDIQLKISTNIRKHTKDLEHLGIDIIKENLFELNGSMTVKETSVKGSTIIVEIPCDLVI